MLHWCNSRLWWGRWRGLQCMEVTSKNKGLVVGTSPITTVLCGVRGCSAAPIWEWEPGATSRCGAVLYLLLVRWNNWYVSYFQMSTWSWERNWPSFCLLGKSLSSKLILRLILCKPFLLAWVLPQFSLCGHTICLRLLLCWERAL